MSERGKAEGGTSAPSSSRPAEAASSPPYTSVDDTPSDNRDHMGEAEARIHHQHTLGRLTSYLRVRSPRNQSRPWHPANALKLPLLEQHLIRVLLDVGQVEYGFGDEQGSGWWVDGEAAAFGREDAVPDRLLHLPVSENALREMESEGQRGFGEQASAPNDPIQSTPSLADTLNPLAASCSPTGYFPNRLHLLHPASRARPARATHPLVRHAKHQSTKIPALVQLIRYIVALLRLGSNDSVAVHATRSQTRAGGQLWQLAQGTETTYEGDS